MTRGEDHRDKAAEERLRVLKLKVKQRREDLERRDACLQNLVIFIII